jgi:hypothetical protein
MMMSLSLKFHEVTNHSRSQRIRRDTEALPIESKRGYQGGRDKGSEFYTGWV